MVNPRFWVVWASCVAVGVGTFSAYARNAVPGPLALRSPASEAKASPEAVQVVHSKVYEMGSNRSKLLFLMTREEKTQDHQTTITEVFTDPEGREAFRSETLLNGDRFVRYDVQQKQLGDSAVIEAKDGKIDFEYTDHNGKVKKSDEKWQDHFVVGAILGRYVKAHWSELLAGKDVEMRFGVPERTETVGFKIFKEDEKVVDGHTVIVTKLKPTSMVIAMLVKPLYFYFDKADGKLIEFKGRILPKLKDGDSWKDVDAESVYSY